MATATAKKPVETKATETISVSAINQNATLKAYATEQQGELRKLDLSQLEERLASDVKAGQENHMANVKRCILDGLLFSACRRHWGKKAGKEKADNQLSAQGRESVANRSYPTACMGYAYLALRGLDVSKLGGQMKWGPIVRRLVETNGADGTAFYVPIPLASELLDGTLEHGGERVTLLDLLDVNTLDKLFKPAKAKVKTFQIKWNLASFDGKSAEVITNAFKQWLSSDKMTPTVFQALQDAMSTTLPPITEEEQDEDSALVNGDKMTTDVKSLQTA